MAEGKAAAPDDLAAKLGLDLSFNKSGLQKELSSACLIEEQRIAVDEMKNVREGIDSKLFNNPRAQLDHRTMLIHWALFALFNSDTAREPILDMFFSAPYINTIQTACPWVLRYLIAAVITGRYHILGSIVATGLQICENRTAPAAEEAGSDGPGRAASMNSLLPPGL